MDKLLSLSHEKIQGMSSTYKDCDFDENGWTSSGDHWYYAITNETTNSSPYEERDDEVGVTSKLSSIYWSILCLSSFGSMHHK